MGEIYAFAGAEAIYLYADKINMENHLDTQFNYFMPSVKFEQLRNKSSFVLLSSEEESGFIFLLKHQSNYQTFYCISRQSHLTLAGHRTREGWALSNDGLALSQMSREKRAFVMIRFVGN